jgi:hypothetical protein
MESTEFRGEDGVCSGDSGGPAIDAEGRVTGIASRSVGCTGSVYSALSDWRGFVREVAELAAREGDYPEPEWLVEAPPQPAQQQEAPESGNVDVSDVEPAPSSDNPSAESPSDNAAEQSTPERAPEGSSPVASDGGGCSLQQPGSKSGGLASSLLLALALARRYRGVRLGRGKQRR